MNYMLQQQKKTARARGDNVQVSTKQCIEICSFLRGKLLDKSMDILERVLEEKEAIPFKRFNDGVGHRPGMAAGRYPVKATAEVLSLLENVKVNASTLGLTGTLKITHIAAQRASSPMRSRLKYRAEFKRTHLEVVVAEVAEKKTATKIEKAPEVAKGTGIVEKVTKEAPEVTKSSEKTPKSAQDKVTDTPVKKTPEVKKALEVKKSSGIVEKKETPVKIPEAKPVEKEITDTPSPTKKHQDSKEKQESVKKEEKTHGN